MKWYAALIKQKWKTYKSVSLARVASTSASAATATATAPCRWYFSGGTDPKRHSQVRAVAVAAASGGAFCAMSRCKSRESKQREDNATRRQTATQHACLAISPYPFTYTQHTQHTRSHTHTHTLRGVTVRASFVPMRATAGPKRR